MTDAEAAETAAFLDVLHSVHELCRDGAPHSTIDAAVTRAARQFAARGVAFLTRLREAEAARARVFEEGRRAGLREVMGAVREAPREWGAEKILSEVVDLAKGA